MALKQHSNLNQLPYWFFGTDAIPPQMLAELLFPFFFGAPAKGPFTIPYWGPVDFPTTACYMGCLPLLLAGAGLAQWRSSRLVRYAGIALPLSLLLAVGTHSPLGPLLYRVPVYNFFRDHAFNALFASLSVAILAAAALSALDRDELTNRTRHRLSVLLPTLFTVAAAIILIKSRSLARGLEPILSPSQQPWIVPFHKTVKFSNPAITLALAFLLVSAMVFFETCDDQGVSTYDG